MKFANFKHIKTLICHHHCLLQQINNTHISGLVNTHFNATLPSTITDIYLLSTSIPPTQVVPPPQLCLASHYRHEGTGYCIPRPSTGIPSFTGGPHVVVLPMTAQNLCTDCTWQQQTNQPETLTQNPPMQQILNNKKMVPPVKGLAQNDPYNSLLRANHLDTRKEKKRLR